MKTHKIEFRGELQPYFPVEQRGNIWLGHPWYWRPKRKDVEIFLEISKLDEREYLKKNFNCNEFARALCVNVFNYTAGLVENEILPLETVLPWAFVEAWALRYKGRDALGDAHNINVVLTIDKGLLCIEPYNDQIWKPTVEDDILLFARG